MSHQTLDLISDASFISETEFVEDYDKIEGSSLPHLPTAQVVPSESLDLSVTDDPHQERIMTALSLDAPRLNTARALKDEIIQLTNRVNKISQATKETTTRTMEAAHRPLSRIGKIGDVGSGVCVNFGREGRLYTNLVTLSVEESELMRAECEKLAHQWRRLIAEAARLHPPKSEILPKPCPMKFFDSQRHIFQSARLDIQGLTDQLPTLEFLSTPTQLEPIREDYRLCTESSYFV